MSKNLPSLLFTIEQWELIRRIRNSGLTREQLCQAYDDLDRVERDLGTIYNLPFNLTESNSNTNPNANMASSILSAQQSLLADPAIFAKNLQIIMAKNIAAQRFLSQTGQVNGTVNNVNGSTSSSTSSSINNGTTHNNSNSSNSSTNSTSSGSNRGTSPNANENIVNQNNKVAHNVISSNNIHEIELEAKELEEFRLKGDQSIHYEISHFIYKHDLKQSQIARMAGVNQAYVSKFIRGDFNDLSENGKTLIYKWYLKFTKNPLMLARHNGALNTNHNETPNGKKSDNEFSFISMINTYDTPKRTRFSFKPDHLVILEKSFAENPYPDPKKREELARLCNEARGDVSDRERVTEPIVTHWFQNKRKLNRKNNYDEVNCSENRDAVSPKEETNSCEQNGEILEYDESPLNYQDFMEEANMAAYKAIMGRMNPLKMDEDVDLKSTEVL